MWALIVDGVVTEVTKIEPAERFHPQLTWIACPEWTQPGAVFNSGGFQNRPASQLPLPTQIANIRYKHETAGLVFEGLRIDTGLDSRTRLMEAAFTAMLDPDYLCTWKTMDGMAELSAEQLIRLATRARAHVQACFDRERALLDAVKEGSYKPEMLGAGWPAGL